MPDKVSGGDGADKGLQNEGAKLVVGEKEYTAKDVENLLSREASLTQESQKVAALRNAAEKYNVSVEDYVNNAEGALAVAAKLMEDGVIDEHGRVIEKKVEGDDHVDPALVRGQHIVQPKPDHRLEGLVKAVTEMGETITELRKDNRNVMKLGLKRDIMMRHSELTDAEALAVVDKVQEDPRKSVWEHAKEAVEAKATTKRAQEEAYAKHFGIDINEWRKRNEQSSQGNEGASAIVGEKKIVFGHRVKLHGGKDKVATPRDAMVRLMNQNLHGKS